jgi:hypothetical protein
LPAAEGKMLPCFSVCALPAYRSIGFFFTEKDFLKNSFELEDFFHNETTAELRNTSLYSGEYWMTHMAFINFN